MIGVPHFRIRVFYTHMHMTIEIKMTDGLNCLCWPRHRIQMFTITFCNENRSLNYYELKNVTIARSKPLIAAPSRSRLNLSSDKASLYLRLCCPPFLLCYVYFLWNQLLSKKPRKQLISESSLQESEFTWQPGACTGWQAFLPTAARTSCTARWKFESHYSELLIIRNI